MEEMELYSIDIIHKHYQSKKDALTEREQKQLLIVLQALWSENEALAKNCLDISTANVRELCIQPEKADELSPAFMFQLTATKLLVWIVNEKIDPVQLAMRELKNRWLNKDGERVGFEKR